MPMEFQSTQSPRRKPPDVYLHTYCQPTNVQSSVDLGAVGAECLSRPDVFTLDAAQRDRLAGRLAYPVHTQVVITSLVLHTHRLSQFCFQQSRPVRVANSRAEVSHQPTRCP